MGAVYWLVLVFVLLLGGVGIAVQTLVAQANGGRRWRRGGAGGVDRAVGNASYGAAVFSPRHGGPGNAASVRARAAVERQALEFWGAAHDRRADRRRALGVLGFFNGISRPRVTLAITLLVAALNAALNRLFIFDLRMGIAGSAWATNVAQLSGWLVAMSLFLATSANARFHSRLMWRLRPARLLRQFLLGFRWAWCMPRICSASRCSRS